MDYKKLKYKLFKYTPDKIKNFYVKRCVNKNYQRISYSQEGEDLILNRIFENQNKGFYIDIGAHHPKRFSNTFLFYEKGWSGINIDAMPGSMKEFYKERPRDINLEIGISKEASSLTYYMFNEPALNTFSKAQAEEKDNFKSFKLINTLTIKTIPLRQIIEDYRLYSTVVDFMNIDVEGLDLEVLESYSWTLTKPKVILIELQNKSITNVEKDAIYFFLKEKGYIFFAKTFNTSFFILDKTN